MRVVPSALLASAALLAPGAVAAGGAGAGCNCAPPPSCSSCGATSAAAATHTVTVPGVYVVPPSVYIAPSRLTGGVGGVGGASSGGVSSGSTSAGSGVSGDVSVSVQASDAASSSASASLLAAAATNAATFSQTSALATANSQAANLLAASGGGGGFSSSESVSSGNIPNLVVSTPGPAAAPRQVCVRTAVVAQAVALQAVCLDDKDVPHPASQVMPGQDVPEGYAGELFRCIAGAHMQYIVAPYGGQARFDHGQTVVCAKGEALWRDAGGRLQCRPQTLARDCNERSLLRRYGAGIKILKAAAPGQCVEWRAEAAPAEAASQGSLQLDGGVGG